MDELELLKRLEQRDEEALNLLSEKYGAWILKIASNILSDRQDREEVLNDTLLDLWNSIPPEHPENLLAYLTVIARRKAVSLYRKTQTEKRQVLREALPLSELSELVSDSDVEDELGRRELSRLISSFLRTERRDARIVFVLRYYYMDSVSDIRTATGFSAAKIKTLLHRTRNRLKEYLKEEGYWL